MGYRLKQNGYDIRLWKGLYVQHLKRWKLVSLLRAEFFYRALPWTELLLNQDQTINDLNLKRSARLSVMLLFITILLMLFGFWWPANFGIAGLLALALIAINFSAYQFFYQKRGLWFTLRVLPWHWLYFGYSGLAYSVGFCRFYMFNQRLSS